jgi:hypothetical protein
MAGILPRFGFGRRLPSGFDGAPLARILLENRGIDQRCNHRTDFDPSREKEAVMPSRVVVGLLSLLTCGSIGSIVSPLGAQNAGVRPGADEPGLSDRELYLNTCASCHGPDGTGLSSAEVGFDLELPGFTDCSFASREPHGDWAGVAHEGGPLRGFDRMMPAFGDALSMEEIERVVAYVKGLCEDTSWPPGEFNIPLAPVTEKAYPEDETVFKFDSGGGLRGTKRHKTAQNQGKRPLSRGAVFL